MSSSLGLSRVITKKTIDTLTKLSNLKLHEMNLSCVKLFGVASNSLELHEMDLELCEFDHSGTSLLNFLVFSWAFNAVILSKLQKFQNFVLLRYSNV